MLVQQQKQTGEGLPPISAETGAEAAAKLGGPYKSKAMQLLAHQLRLSPRQQIPHQLLGIQKLLMIIKDGQHYPYELVCFHLTGYQNKHGELGENILGKILRKDLLLLAKELCWRERFLPEELPCSCIFADELQREMKVARKTLSRWASKGLVPIRIFVDAKVTKNAYLGTMVARFKAEYLEVVERAAGFSRTTDEERERIVRRGRELMLEEPMSLSQLSIRLAKEFPRSHNGIFIILKGFKAENPNDALSRGGTASGSTEGMEMLAASRAGESASELSARFGRSEEEVRAILLRERCFDLKRKAPKFFEEALFRAPEAEEVIVLAPEPPALPDPKKGSIPSDVHPFVQNLYHLPLLGPKLEQFLFRKYNYLKFRTAAALERLDPDSATETEIRAIERSEREINQLWQRLVSSNLRLVVNIARQNVRRGVSFDDLVSEGNLILGKAVRLFDHRRGYKFSTYFAWALRKQFMQYIVEHEKALARCRSGEDKALARAQAREPRADAPPDDLRKIIASKVDQLPERERDIIRAHYGLGEDAASLEEIGQRYGVSKERVRQIERRARAKLLELFGAEPMPEV